MGGHRDSHIDRLIRPAGSAHAMNGSGCRPGPTKWLNFLIPFSHLLVYWLEVLRNSKLDTPHHPPENILMLPDTCLGGNVLPQSPPDASTSHLTSPTSQRPSVVRQPAGPRSLQHENPDLHRPCNTTCRTNFSARLCNSGWHDLGHSLMRSMDMP